MEPVVHDILARGVRTRVLELGDRGAPPLVLLHGFLAGHRSFEDLLEPLARRFRVIAPDFPGFGESAKPPPGRYGYDLPAFAETVVDLVAALGLGPASLVGHDMGGSVALHLAVRHPEVVSKLVLVAPLVYGFPRPRRMRPALAPLVGGVYFKQLFGRTSFRGYFRDAFYSTEMTTPLARVDAHYDAFNTPAGRESAFAVLHAILDTRPVTALVTRANRPALVVWGVGDRLVPPRHAQRLSRELRARLVLLDAAHAAHEEQPARFLRTVHEFFEGG